MCKIKQYLNKEKLSNARNWANEHGVVGYLVVCLAVIYALLAYKSLFMSWYGDYVVPVLERFIPNLWSILLTFVLVFFAIFDLTKKYRMRYQYDNKVIIALPVVAYLLVNCRLSDDYYYVHWVWFVSYVDVIWLLCIAYFFVAAINKCRKYFKSDNRKNESDKIAVDYNKLILNDWPIECKDDDIFDLDEEASKLANAIGGLDKDRTWSLAITAPWGAGKTSFLNLLFKHISKKDFEVVYFVPRDSKSVETIQEDFFSIIACVLSKYDHRCSHTMKDYMASLQLIDNRGVVEKLVNFYRIWNKVSLKETIKQTFSSLKKKVLVLIDDFDRLSKDEILEVLKLIDCNAAFTNLVFLTAYDKQQVNKSLDDTSSTADACFVDKFFNLEFSIPSRPYSYISKYIEDNLCELLDASEDEKMAIQQTINERNSTFKEYIPTLRDAKRYINQFVLDFMHVRGDVMIDEFLLIQLVKYRYPELYKEVYGMKHLRKELWEDGGRLFLMKDLDSKLKILPVLSILFPDDVLEEKVVNELPYHIFNVNGFDNYFVNKIYSVLRIRDMEQLLSLEWAKAIDTINGWIEDAGKLKDVTNYLDFSDMDKFKDGKFYMRYSELVTYLACKLPGTRAFWLFIRVIIIRKLEGYDKRYGLDFNLYKEQLLDVIKHEDVDLNVISSLHVGFKTSEIKEEEILIKDADIWPYMQEKFIQATNDTARDGVWLRSRLKRCIDHIEESSQLVYLDPKCLKAYRECVENKPDLYISNFVFLGVDFSDSGLFCIACDAFWRQIFGDETQLESYLTECCAKKIAKSDLAWNFWQLYKANDFEPIPPDNHVALQEKIDNNLVDEVKKLDRMRHVEEEILKVPDDMNSLSADEKTEYKQILLRCKEELKGIKLYISLNDKLNRLIDKKLEAYK